ncbi:glycerophosphoryl diester phosphodiesterase family protein [Phyllosticta citricarpa]|uniref:Glycerophosphoryl diester phosphodiesterase family protein n=1 Tax=Phyllosticta citricarpa TaxID=55181 RepID=A0ABR1LFU5_9PEZI
MFGFEAEGSTSSLRLRTTVGESITLPSWRRLLMEPTESQPLLEPRKAAADMSTADFALARRDKHGRKVPQAIAHRGYKAKYPENSMAAFVGAVEAGAQAIETDVHLSKDGAVVLSHDPSLQRCFGKKEKVIDCNWDYLETLRTVAEPHVPLARLRDLLKYLTTEGLEDVWVLLDIKRDNKLDDVFRLIAAEIASVAPSPTGKPWSQRIVLGIWAANYLTHAAQHLPHYPQTYISFSLPCANKFLHSLPHISFNLYAPILIGPLGARFRAQARRQRRPVFDWTVNKEALMRWSVASGLDGVVTDEVEKFVAVRERWNGELLLSEGRQQQQQQEEEEGEEEEERDGGGGAVGAKKSKDVPPNEIWNWEGWGWAQLVDLAQLQVVLLLLTPALWWWQRPWSALDQLGRVKAQERQRRSE